MKRLAPLARILILLAATGLVIVLIQDRLLYFPERVALAELLPPSGRDVSPWPDAAGFRGLLIEPDGTPRGTVVVFHGNAGHAGHRMFYAGMLVPLGWRVLLVEYPGYGPREGAPGEAVLVADAVATLDLARQHFGPLVVLGESLGAGVAAAAAARVDDEAALSGLLLVTPWDSLPAVAAHHYAWLPRWLIDHVLRDRYDSLAHLRGSKLPVTVVVAGNDVIVPAAHGRRLFEALGPGRRLREIAAAGHNDWPDHVDAAWWRELMVPFAGLPTAPVD